MISFIGGTGKLGFGLAMRFANAGEEVIIGSRKLDKANGAADRILEKIPDARVRALENREAAEESGIVFLAVPYPAQGDILRAISEALHGKVLVSVVNPFKCVNGEFVKLNVAHGSAAEEAQAFVPHAKVVSAFKNISHEVFTRIEEPIRCDTIVCSDHEDAKKVVMDLAEKIGVKPIDGGPLRISRYLDAVTILLLNVNKRYGGNACLKIEFYDL